MANLNTEKLSSTLRAKAINVDEKSILITNFSGSEQEKDLSEPANCNGFGRVRHFQLNSGRNWVSNPLPILPAAKALGISSESSIRAQVFQNSVCNWRCWYCFVDFKLLNGDSKFSSFLTCDKMIDLYLAQDDPPKMIDLTGGQPDLTPEWIPWMMKVLQERGLDEKIYLWSDDNLSNEYLWQYLSDDQINLMSNYKMYSRVCCFKGIDQNSFTLNTKADPKLYQNQFHICRKLLDINIDLYCYVTLTASLDTDFGSAIPRFLDSMQEVDKMLPLRTVPLKISEFTPVAPRMTDVFRDMMNGQFKAIEIWNKELQIRFSPEQLQLPITDIAYKRTGYAF